MLVRQDGSISAPNGNNEDYMREHVMLILCLICLCLAHCTGTSSQIQQLHISVSQGNSPCWEGLCVGQHADKEQVANLLRKMDGVSEVEVNREVNEVVFEWHDVKNDISIGGSVVPYADHIQGISLRPVFKMTLGEFISKYGEPNCVYVLDTINNDKSITLESPDVGIVARLDYVDGDTYQHIVKSMLIYQISLTPPINKEECTSRRLFRVYKWQGFDAVYP
jgi:hypothetical protein